QRSLTADQIAPLADAFLSLCRVARECRFESGIELILSRDGKQSDRNVRMAIHLFRLSWQGQREQLIDLLQKIGNLRTLPDPFDARAACQQYIYRSVIQLLDMVVPYDWSWRLLPNWLPDLAEVANIQRELSGPTAAEGNADLASEGEPETPVDFHNVGKEIDVAVITVKIEEFEAVQKRLRRPTILLGARRTCWFSRLTAQNGEWINIVHARTLEQGKSEAQALAHDLIEDFHPGFIVLVGIAGGIPAHEYSLGDVLLASRIQDFSVSAANEGGMPHIDVRGGQVHPRVRDLLVRVEGERQLLGNWNAPDSVGTPRPRIELGGGPDRHFYGEGDWQLKLFDCLKSNFLTERPPLFRVGTCGSSDILVKNTALCKHWQDSGGRTISHVEMELAGVYAAAWGDPMTPVLAIRGISDIVGFTRTPSWTNYACQTAASLFIELIKTGLLKRN
ncbi:MAG TPA: hypothetical protein VGY66_33120, partial [Gemmataceae bacterium]|nr:hypothetical protein [Gemmataceae bacterium]